MPDHVHEGDFYEDDEPLEDIVAAWESSTEGGLTEAPSGLFVYVSVSQNKGMAAADLSNVGFIPIGLGGWLTDEETPGNTRKTDPVLADAG